MVCLGNICRSPLAEGILKNKIKHLDIEVDSAGTADYHVGKPPDIRSIEIGLKNNIDISNQRARKFCIKDFDEFDKIYAMDESNYKNIMKLARNTDDEDKIDLILNEINPGKFQSVPDPYYGGSNGFEEVYKMLEFATDKILIKIER